MKQPYELLPITADDMDAAMAVNKIAFLHDALRTATFPPGLVDPAQPDGEAEFHRRRFRKRLGNPRFIMHKILADDGSIAGISGWIAPPKDGAEANEDDASSSVNPTGEVPGCANRELFEAQMRLQKEMQERILGDNKNFWYLSSLATHPDHQGKGIGAALVRWGIEQAEKDCVPAYLEATPHGAFLYKKLGFEPVDEVDMSKWLPDGEEYKFLCMLKEPSSKAK
ncbi:putative gnat family protein [Neofusicoccum parvum UCRNP2]|uniref:Putative gnat family protein n=1 Tax=Botryosphaeria parva (strain UCR-NP2) TaxID=1287680 RepID=R1GIH4_BOTPV|nr:putative gnat family protein [Neofusicoccum parvum UCRNP2]